MPDAPAAPITQTPTASPAPPSAGEKTATPTPFVKFADTFKALDEFAASLNNGDEKTPESNPKDLTAQPDKPTETDKQPDEKKPEPDNGGKPADAKPDSATPEIKGAAQLRFAYDTAKQELAAKEKLITELQAKIGDNSKEQEWQTERQALQERQAKLEEKLSYLDYSQSDEYAEKYQKPLDNALQSAAKDVKELLVTDNDGNQREANWQDFSLLLRKPLAEAAKLAKEMFGEASTEVMAHRRRILESNEAASKAVEEFKSKGSESAAKQKAAHEAESKRLAGLWEQVNKEKVSQYKVFQPDPADPEGNQKLEEGFKIADAHFNGMEGLSPEQRIQLASVVRLQSAAFPRVLSQLKTAKAQIEKLTKELDGFKGSTPRGQGDAPTNGESRGGARKETVDDTLRIVLGKK